MSEPLQRIITEANYQHAKEMIELGIEYTRECLARHDSDLGRTTLKNQRYAEMMETDIQNMQQILNDL